MKFSDIETLADAIDEIDDSLQWSNSEADISLHDAIKEDTELTDEQLKTLNDYAESNKLYYEELASGFGKIIDAVLEARGSGPRV